MKKFISKAKMLAFMAAGAMSMIMFSVVGASAADSPITTAKTDIIAEFTALAADISPILVSVLGAGLGLFGLFAGLRLAKKMFTAVSK